MSEVATLPETATAVTLEQLTEQAIAQIAMPVEIADTITAPSVRERHQAQVEALREQYAGMRIDGVDDKKGFEAVQKAITAVTGIATSIDKIRKEVTAPWDKAKKQVDQYAGQLEADVRNKVLMPLVDEKRRILSEVDRIEREAREAAALKLSERKKAVHTLGLMWNGMQYVHTLPGVDPISEPDVNDLADDAFDRMLEKAALQVSTERDAKVKADEKAKEDQRIADETRLKQEEQAKENARKAEELAAKEKEINDALRQSRVDALIIRGMVINQADQMYIGRINVDPADLIKLSTSQFDALCRDVEDEKLSIQQAEAKAHQEKTLRGLRILELQKAGLVLDPENDTLSIDGGTAVEVDLLHAWTEQEFGMIVTNAKAERAAFDKHIKDQEEEMLRLQALGMDRAAKLTALGAHTVCQGRDDAFRYGKCQVLASALRTMSEEQFSAVLGTFQVAIDTAKEEAEARRTDFERMQTYINALKAVPVPKFQSAIAKHCAELLQEHIGDAWLGVQKDLK